MALATVYVILFLSQKVMIHLLVMVPNPLSSFTEIIVADYKLTYTDNKMGGEKFLAAKTPLLRTNCESPITLYVVKMCFSRENVDKINLQGS